LTPLLKSLSSCETLPLDYRGNSEGEAVEITQNTLAAYKLTCEQIEFIRKNPGKWKTIELR
jgi:hypothetical protein